MSIFTKIVLGVYISYMNNSDKSILNNLYQQTLAQISQTFMSGDQATMTKLSAKLVAIQEIMEALGMKSPAPVITPAPTSAPTPAPEPPKPAVDPRVAQLQALSAQGASPEELFAALGASSQKLQPAPKYGTIDPWGPQESQIPGIPGMVGGSNNNSPNAVSIDKVLTPEQLARISKIY